MHMGDIVESRLGQSLTAFMTDDRRLVSEIERMDNAVDRLHEAIKLYVTEITRESLDGQNGQRAMEIIAFSINLEHIGDIIDKNLMELASKNFRWFLIFLLASSIRFLAMISPICSRLIEKAMISMARWPFWPSRLSRVISVT